VLPAGYVKAQGMTTTAATGSGTTTRNPSPSPSPSTTTDCDVKGDVTIATIEMFEYLKSQTVLSTRAAREALVAWLRLLQASHLVPVCADGAGEALRVLERAWPVDADAIVDMDAWRAVRVCGENEVLRPYVSCLGSTPETRGYTCGLWMLLHSTSVRMPEGGDGGDGGDGERGLAWLGVVEGYIRHFFQCADCAEHFLESLGGADAKAVRSKRDAVLWLWRTHNAVNERLVREDAAGTNPQDPVYKHVQWPVREVCGGCYDGRGAWDEDGGWEFVYAQYYGRGTATGRVGAGAGVERQAGGSSWFQALVVVCIVMGVVYSSLKKNTVQYGGRGRGGGVGYRKGRLG